jgi:hypothetical protein
MRCAGQRSPRFLLLPPLLLLCACNQTGQAVPQQDDGRFEFKQDQQGRTLRLDKGTGEIAVVEGTRVIPLKSDAPQTGPTRRDQPPPRSTPSPRPTPPQRRASELGGGQRQIAGPTISTSETVRGTTRSSESRPQLPATPRPGQVSKDGSAVFLTPTSYQTPLQFLNSGASVQVIGNQGNWYQIEFDDPQWGRRLGFILRSDVSSRGRNSSQTEPVDLSVPGLKPSQLKPLDRKSDVSSRGRNSSQMEPIDLSVPGLKPKTSELEPLDLSIRDKP